MLLKLSAFLVITTILNFFGNVNAIKIQILFGSVISVVCVNQINTQCSSCQNIELTSMERLVFMRSTCLDAFTCKHSKLRVCGIEPKSREVRRFLDMCDMFEFNCEYKTILLLNILMNMTVSAHGPPQERDNEDISMGRKMGAKWCGMAKVCNHDRVPICGVSHAGDVMGFRDLCDMFDFNCIRRRNYRQTGCPEDKSLLTVSRRPTSSFYDE